MKRFIILISICAAALMSCSKQPYMKIPAPEKPAIPDASSVDWISLADSTTFVLTDNFIAGDGVSLTVAPGDAATAPEWCQAVAVEVLLSSYMRTKAPALADLFSAWAAKTSSIGDSDLIGLCWATVALLDLADNVDPAYFAQAKALFEEKVYDGWAASGDAHVRLAGSIAAARLFASTGDNRYFKTAAAIVASCRTSVLSGGNVEGSAKTHTQGAFAEACRRLYHASGEKEYLSLAARALSTAFTTSCLDSGYLKGEGAGLPECCQKAVLVNCAAAYACDSAAPANLRVSVAGFLFNNGMKVSSNLDRKSYPEMYVAPAWKDAYVSGVNLGAQVSGSALFEAIARYVSNK